jgi:hypothetical protein
MRPYSASRAQVLAPLAIKKNHPLLDKKPAPNKEELK